MLRRSVLRYFVLLGFIGVTGCASSGEAGTSRSSTTTVLTQEEIVTTNVSNLYEAIERLRPRWLQMRGVRSMGGSDSQIVVYLNRSYLGAPDVLKGYDTRAALRIRYLDGPTAASTLTGLPGNMHIEGAIVLETNPGGR